MDKDRSEPSETRSDRQGQDRTPGGHAPEKVEDRPMTGTVQPEDYPEGDRATGRPDR